MPGCGIVAVVPGVLGRDPVEGAPPPLVGLCAAETQENVNANESIKVLRLDRFILQPLLMHSEATSLPSGYVTPDSESTNEKVRAHRRDKTAL